jgi:predicted enzyme related to lactoylglutathione lyase
VSEPQKPLPGTIAWLDLTVPDADRVRDFYTAVVGWSPQPVEMGGYADYSMQIPDGEEVVAGVCHARGENSGQPPYWMPYVIVADLEESLRRCEAGGGKVVTAVRDSGPEWRFCVIQDPAGAYVGLMQSGA